MAYFLISESNRPIQFRIRANEVQVGTLRLLASTDKKEVAVFIQAIEPEGSLSFEVSKERLLLAGKVFDILTCSPCHRMENGLKHPDPLTEEKIEDVFSSVEKAFQSRHEETPDDARQLVLRIIWEESLSVVPEPDPGFERKLMEAVEKSLRAANL